MRGFNLICQIVLATLLLSFQWTTETQKEKTQNKEPQKNQEFLSITRYPLVMISAQVISRTTGLPVSDLRHTDFVISENGIQQDIAIWEQGDEPVSLLILIDTLDAHKNSRVFNDQIQALKSSLTTYFSAEDKASIIVIVERPILLQDFTSDKELISDAFDRLSQYKIVPTRPVEKRFSEALQQAANHARVAHNPKARNAIILISSVPNQTDDKAVLPETVVRAMIESGNIFCWDSSAHLRTDFFDLSDPGELPFDKVSIADLVRLTGGEFMGSDWKSFIERLRERHLIGYVPLPIREGRGGELVRIKLELAPNPKRNTGDMVLIYPRAGVIPSLR